ncbi:GemA protein [Candidatus Magnetomoraceae bacterium gMMP-15]
MRAITKEQIKMIKIGQRDLCIDDATYREMLFNNFHKRTCTRLTRSEAGRLINLLKSKGFKPKRKRTASVPRNGNIVKIVSKKELNKIEALSKLIQWRFEDGIRRWMQKRFNIEVVRTSYQAYQIIDGLKKMFENKMKKEHGANWWGKSYTDEAIRRYIEEHGPRI